MQTYFSLGPSWPILAHLGPSWPILAHLGPSWPILAHLGPLQTHTAKILEALWIPSTQWVHRATGLAWNQKDLEMICISNHSNPRKLEAFKLPVSSSIPKYHTCLNTWMGDVDQCKHYRESERERERGRATFVGNQDLEISWNTLNITLREGPYRTRVSGCVYMCVMLSHFSEAPLLVKTQFQSDLHLYCNLWKGKGRLLFWKQTSINKYKQEWEIVQFVEILRVTLSQLSHHL